MSIFMKDLAIFMRSVGHGKIQQFKQQKGLFQN